MNQVKKRDISGGENSDERTKDNLTSTVTAGGPQFGQTYGDNLFSSNQNLNNPAHQELEIFSDQTPMQSRAAADGTLQGAISQA